MHLRRITRQIYFQERDKMTPQLWNEILRRDQYECQIKILGICTKIATQVDHKIPLYLGGKTIESNLQAACKACNTWKGASIVN